MRKELPKNTNLEKGFFLEKEGGKKEKITKVVAHFNTYEEAVKFQEGTTLVLRYYLQEGIDK